MQSSQGQSKFWCFTINNPRPFYADLSGVKSWDYMIVGNEIGDEGTPHLQGFVAYKIRTRFSTIKAQMPKAHIEKMLGTPKSASEYCMKDGDYEEFGTLPDYNGGASGGAAKAKNYRAMAELAQANKIDEIMDIDPVSYVQHYHAYKRIAQDHPAPPNKLDDVCGEWLVGEPGVGKSFKAREDNPNYFDKAINKWWDGYQGEPVVILDDLDLVHHVLGHHLKRWADRYAFPAEQKGSTIQIRPQKIIVTSNYTIEEIFSQDGDVLVAALKRRFKTTRILDWKLGMPGPKFAEHSAHSQEESEWTDEEDRDLGIDFNKPL